MSRFSNSLVSVVANVLLPSPVSFAARAVVGTDADCPLPTCPTNTVYYNTASASCAPCTDFGSLAITCDAQGALSWYADRLTFAGCPLIALALPLIAEKTPT